jgi:glycosyltransferase involved in cell wall biosynthesis
MRRHDEPTGAPGAPHPPRVSVVIPTRDRPATARRAVASALAQRDVDVEVVVVDDGSAVPFAAAGEPRVTVLRHNAPRGVAAARNAGRGAAQAPWVALLDDDDFWAPDKLRVQLAAAAAAGAGFAYCSALVVAGARALAVAEALPAPELALGLRRRNLVPAGASNVLVAADAVREAGGFDERLRHLADWDLWSRLLQVTAAASSPDALVAYVQHPGSMHVAERATVRAEARLLRRLHRDGGGPIDAFDHGVLRLFVADGHRQAGRHWTAAAVQGLAGVRHRRPAYLREAAGELARSAGVRRERRVRPATPDWVTDQWAGPAAP